MTTEDDTYNHGLDDIKVTGACDAGCGKLATTWFGDTACATCGDSACVNVMQDSYDREGERPAGVKLHSALATAQERIQGLEAWAKELLIDKAELQMRIRLLDAALLGPGTLLALPSPEAVNELKRRLANQLQGWIEALASAHEDDILQGGWVLLASIHELRALDVLTRTEAVHHRFDLTAALTAVRPELVEGFGELPELN